MDWQERSQEAPTTRKETNSTEVHSLPGPRGPLPAPLGLSLTPLASPGSGRDPGDAERDVRAAPAGDAGPTRGRQLDSYHRWRPRPLPPGPGASRLSSLSPTHLPVAVERGGRAPRGERGARTWRFLRPALGGGLVVLERANARSSISASPPSCNLSLRDMDSPMSAARPALRGAARYGERAGTSLRGARPGHGGRR